jgi:hypothetical protein
MSERLQYDWHLASDLCREADELLNQALSKLHAAEALYRMDNDRPSISIPHAGEVRDTYDLVAKARNTLTDAAWR